MLTSDKHQNKNKITETQKSVRFILLLWITSSSNLHYACTSLAVACV